LLLLCAIAIDLVCDSALERARARRRSGALLRSVLPAGVVGAAGGGDDVDSDYQLDDMSQLLRPRTSVTGRSDASLTGVWTRHARTIDGNQSWQDKIGGRVVTDTTDDIVLVSQDQPWTNVDESAIASGGGGANGRLGRSSTLTTMADTANALNTSSLTSQQKALVRRFCWTNNISTVMKGSQYRDLESLFLLEAKSYRETSSARTSRDTPSSTAHADDAARRTVGAATTGALAPAAAAPVALRQKPAADYQVAVVNELLAQQPSSNALEP
jgi:hypothetical protein